MFSMVGLHMFYSMLITLMLVNKKYLGKHAYLSTWEIYLKTCKTFAKILFDLPKSYQSHMMIHLENLILKCYLSCIELCQIVVTLERIIFMLS